MSTGESMPIGGISRTHTLELRPATRLAAHSQAAQAPAAPLVRENFRTAVVTARREKEERREAAAVSALDLIAAAAGPGPLHMLLGAYETGARVRIVTRHARGVRGTATGALFLAP